jgi:Na+-driven multidrug efflux pump
MILRQAHKTYVGFKNIRFFKLDLYFIGSFLLIGLAPFLRNITQAFTGTFINHAISSISKNDTTSIMASYGTITPLFALLLPVHYGIVQGSRAVTSYCYGAGRFDRVKNSYYIIFTFGLVYGLFSYFVVG